MKITDQQHLRLDSLSCQRLSSRTAHKELIKLVHNSRNSGLSAYLNKYGWDEDIDGNTAYYIIKDTDENILLFFSLKCGALLQHLDEEQLREQKQFYEVAKRLIENPENDEEREIASLILDKFRRSGFISDDEKKLLSQLRTVKNDLHTILSALTSDKSIDPNEHIVRVSSTHSGVELVHLCANDLMRHKWKDYGIPHSLGKAIFWKFIIPIVENVRRLVGCKYLFLFAADSTVDLSLVNYYEVDLHFKRPKNIGTNKPRYDFNCVFMCQEIEHLSRERKLFFDNFNPDIDEDIV